MKNLVLFLIIMTFLFISTSFAVEFSADTVMKEKSGTFYSSKIYVKNKKNENRIEGNG